MVPLNFSIGAGWIIPVFPGKQAVDWGFLVAIHPDDVPRMLAKYKEALNSGQPFEMEGRFRRFDGEFRWFLFRGSPWHDESGKVVKWYGTNTDLEDRKRAEEVLRASEQNFRLIVDSIPGLVNATTANGEVELVSQRVLDFFGKTFEEVKRIGFRLCIRMIANGLSSVGALVENRRSL